MLAHLIGNILVEVVRMGLLVRDADFGQVVEDEFAFDFQLLRQVANSNCVHLSSLIAGSGVSASVFY